MIIKEKISSDLPMLNDLLQSYPSKKQVIEEQIRKTEAGENEEFEAARYLNRILGRSEISVLLHDLRFELPDGEAFQIDHLLINRALIFTVMETKSARYGLKVDSDGNFFRKYRGSNIAIPSPVNQVKTQAMLLRELLRHESAMPKRLGMALTPSFETAVLVAPTVDLQIENDDIKPFVYRYDESVFKIEQAAERMGVAATLGRVANLVGIETLVDIAQKLVALHRPKANDWKGFFGIRDDVAYVNSDVILDESDCHSTSLPEAQHCSHVNRSIQYGRSYYFKCDDCGYNQSIKLPKGQKLRKQGNQYFVVHEDGTNQPFFTNRT